MDENKTLEELTESYSDPYVSPEQEQPVEETPVEQPEQPVEQEQPAQPEQPVSAYDSFSQATQRASAYDELAALRAQNAQLQQALQQAQVQQAQAANESVAQALQEAKMPVFDNEAYAYASDDERAKMMNDYTNGLMNYAMEKTMKSVRDEMAPVIDEYRRRNAESQFNSSLDQVKDIDGFGDIADYRGEVERIASMPEFANLDPNKRAVIAATIYKGIRANKPVEKDLSARVEDVMNDPELMKAISEKQALQVKEQNGSFPVHTASNGLSSASFPTPHRAQTIEELISQYEN